MKLIDLHKEWCEAGKLPYEGLCESFPDGYKALLEMFEPTNEDEQELIENDMPWRYWGCGISKPTDFQRFLGYTPLRQTIVLS